MTNPVSLIIWLIISIACAIIHKNKGYNPIVGFIAGLLLSWISLILILVEKDKETADKIKAEKEAKKNM